MPVSLLFPSTAHSSFSPTPLHSCVAAYELPPEAEVTKAASTTEVLSSHKIEECSYEVSQKGLKAMHVSI